MRAGLPAPACLPAVLPPGCQSLLTSTESRWPVTAGHQISLTAGVEVKFQTPKEVGFCQLSSSGDLAPVEIHFKFQTPKEKETSKSLPWLSRTLT